MFRSHSVAVSFVLAGALAASSCGWKDSPAVAPVTSAVQRLSQPLVSGSFVVEPRRFKEFKVVVTNDMINPRLEGSFSASGARNDIEVTLFEETQFLNWENRNRFEAHYESGRATAGRLNIDLPGTGTYVLVFSNRFSILSNKAVTADVKLLYDKGL